MAPGSSMKIPQMNRIQYGAEPSKKWGPHWILQLYNYDIGIHDIYIYIYIRNCCAYEQDMHVYIKLGYPIPSIGSSYILH